MAAAGEKTVCSFGDEFLCPEFWDDLDDSDTCSTLADDDTEPQSAQEHSTDVTDTASTSTTCTNTEKSKSKCLNKKERDKILDGRKSLSDEIILDEVIKQLSEEQLQHYPEREVLLLSLLDSSEPELKVVCHSLLLKCIRSVTQGRRNTDSLKWNGTMLVPFT